MFTGIIENIGIILSKNIFDKQARLRVKPLVPFENYQQGESIAINGACLTLENYANNWFEVYASEETLNRTNLKKLGIGTKVNLERALAVGQSFGGHFVSGHVDTVARVQEIGVRGNSRFFRIAFDKNYNNEIISKGSVALDGISLTINDCGDSFLEVNIVPETLRRTVISQWKIGSEVNMETDLIGKYINKQLQGLKQNKDSNLTMDFLLANGF